MMTLPDLVSVLCDNSIMSDYDSHIRRVIADAAAEIIALRKRVELAEAEIGARNCLDENSKKEFFELRERAERAEARVEKLRDVLDTYATSIAASPSYAIEALREDDCLAALGEEKP